jgi:hypothetical protein
VHSLFHAQEMRTGNTGTGGADVDGLAQLDEFRASGIGCPDEYGNLYAYASRAPSSRGIHPGFLTNLLVHARVHSVSTGELVQESRFNASIIQPDGQQGEHLQSLECKSGVGKFGQA